MIELGVLITSFRDTARACRVAAEKQELACLRNNSGQIAVIAAPGDNPHVLYKTYFAAMHDDDFLNDYYASRVNLLGAKRLACRLCVYTTTEDSKP